MNLSNPIFKMALSGLKKVMAENGIKKVIFEFKENGEPDFETAPEDLTTKEFERLKSLNVFLENAYTNLSTELNDLKAQIDKVESEVWHEKQN